MWETQDKQEYLQNQLLNSCSLKKRATRWKTLSGRTYFPLVINGWQVPWQGQQSYLLLYHTQVAQLAAQGQGMTQQVINPSCDIYCDGFSLSKSNTSTQLPEECPQTTFYFCRKQVRFFSGRTSLWNSGLHVNIHKYSYNLVGNNTLKKLSSTQNKCSKNGLFLPHTCFGEKILLKWNELPPMICQQISPLGTSCRRLWGWAGPES